MNITDKQRTAEALVHMSYGRSYAKALESQGTISVPQHRKEAAAAILAESAATAQRDPSTIRMKDAQEGRAAMQTAYGAKASDVSAVLSGRVADYDLPKGYGGTKDLSALATKAQILVEQSTVESYAARGHVGSIGSRGNYLEMVDNRAAETKEKLVSHMLHVKSAIDSAVDRKTFDREQGDMLYQRFQKSAFDPGAKQQSNANFADFEKATVPRLQREVTEEVEQRYAAQSKTIARAKEKELDPINVSRADAFRNLPVEEGMKKHPELAGAYVALAAVSKQAESHGLNDRQRAAVLEHSKNNIAATIEKGQIPELKVREVHEAKREAVAER
jgi:hypothetical protein